MGQNKTNSSTSRSRGHGRRRVRLFFVIFFVFIICGMVSYRRVLLEQDRLKAEESFRAAVERVEEETEREEELSALRVYSKTKKFVEDMAREIYGLVYENEIVFKPEE